MNHVQNLQPRCRCRTRLEGAFSLIELLAVVVIIGLMFAVVVPSMLSALNATRLTQSGDEVFGMINQAQQLASSKGRPIEVRFYRSGTGSAGSLGDGGEVNGYTGVMVVAYYLAGEPDPDNMARPLAAPISVVEFGGIIKLPSSVLIHEGDLSTLISDAPVKEVGASSGAQMKVRRSTGLVDFALASIFTSYSSFLCLPEGTNLSPAGNKRWFVTLVSERDVDSAAAKIKNFVTIQIDPVTGLLSLYRP
jgi:uncharacterized protein (TIGR02596 family)